NARWPRAQTFNSWAAVQSTYNRKNLFLPKQCLVVRNGLDLDSFRYVALPSVRKIHILGIGSLFEVKRWDRLILAAHALKEERFDFVVRVVGDGPLRGSLKRQVQGLGLTEYVEFVGHVDDIPRMLAQSAFLVHTSDKEGCPNAIMEAMGCGRAVVATE